MVHINNKGILIAGLILVLFLLLPPVSEPVSFHGVFNDFFDSFTLITGLVGDNSACANAGGTCTFGSCASGYESAGAVEDENCYSISILPDDSENPELLSGGSTTGLVIKSITGRAVEGWNCCVPIEPYCGDTFFNGDETCESCPEDSEGKQSSCAIGFVCDLGECIPEGGVVVCGDSRVDAPEVCDNTNLNGETCVSRGFDQGTLACNADCSAFVTSGCSNDIDEPVCGNNNVEGSEVCDGSDLNGQTCVSQGFSAGGTLACNNYCTGFVMTDCNTGSCDNCITASCDDCALECYHQETADCQGIDKVTGADTICSISGSCITRIVPKTCGNNAQEDDEECDGIDVGIWKCSTFGFYTDNDLGCDNYCLIDPSTCISTDDNNDDAAGASGGSADDSSCGGIGGVCMNGCMSGYTYQQDTVLDSGCVDSFDISSLVCCVEGEEVLTSPTGENLDISEELRRSLEEQNTQATNGQQESNLINILTSPKALGSAWIVFLLSAIIIVVSAYIHKKFVKK
nr:hypothetical protein [Nanoarchaeum sp.]